MEAEDWEDYHDQDDSKEFRERELRLVKESYKKLGLIDGIEDGKVETLQAGFDEGFKAGAAVANDIEFARGALSALVSTETSKELRARMQRIADELHQHSTNNTESSNLSNLFTEAAEILILLNHKDIADKITRH